MNDREFFGAVHFSTFVITHHPDRINDSPKHKRVSLGKVDCFYEDREKVMMHFVESNPHISKKDLAVEFRFWEPVF